MRRILITGSGNIPPVNVVCQNLHEFGSVTYYFGGLNLFKSGTLGVTSEYKYINDFYEVKRMESLSKLPKLTVLKHVKSRFSPVQIIKLTVEFIFKPSFAHRKLKKAVIDEEFKIQLQKIYHDYDIICAQSLGYENADILQYLPEKKYNVIAIWGSDLMALAGVDIYAKQLKVLQRSDKIIVSGFEMEQILLSKFGRNLKSKTTVALFGLTSDRVTKICNNYDHFWSIGKRLLEKYNIDPLKYNHIIKLGYSGFESQNHIIILNEISKLPKDILMSLLFVIPVTYGGSENYKCSIKNFINESGLNAILIEEYLSDEEAISLSFICDIMLNLRENDGLNNSMIESILASSVVINGCWLPYSVLKRAGIGFVEIYDYSLLNTTLIELLSNFDLHKSNAKNNSHKLSTIISGKANTLAWEKALLNN